MNEFIEEEAKKLSLKVDEKYSLIISQVLIVLIQELIKCGFSSERATKLVNRRGFLVRRNIIIEVYRRIDDKKDALKVERVILKRCKSLENEEVKRLLNHE